MRPEWYRITADTLIVFWKKRSRRRSQGPICKIFLIWETAVVLRMDIIVNRTDRTWLRL